MNRKKLLSLSLCCAVGLLMFSCKEINRQTSPIELVVTNTQTISQIDLVGGTGCTGSLGTINMSALLKPGAQAAPPSTPSQFNDVKINQYRVSYARTDGGTLVPDSFVRTTSSLLTVGGAASTLNDFLVFNAGAFNQAPFVSLDPRNGGVDPETGRHSVQMDVIVEIFGQTIAGENVYGSTRFPLTFCFNCPVPGCH